MRIGSVRRNSQVLQRLYGFETVESFGNENRAAGFVGDVLIDWGRRRDRKTALGGGQRRAEQQGCGDGQESASEARTCDFFHESPLKREFYRINKKAPRDT